MIRDVKPQTLIDVFENKYSEESFKKFVREFFDLSSEDFIGQYVEPQNNHHIKNHTHIANYNIDPKTRVAIFSVCLKRSEFLERARTAQRNYIANLLRSSPKFDTAIVAFYAENEPKWRLSFVKLDYDFVAGKEKEYLTPAKRYSYLVGEKEPSHTAQEKLLPIFMAEGFKPSIAKIEEAFSVEEVTDQFFSEYREKYNELYECLDKNESFQIESQRCEFSTEQFCKKLLGQLSFLYFLQKKGWLGVHAISQTITEKEYKNAYYRCSGAEHKEVVSNIFRKTNNGDYKLSTGILRTPSFTDELADLLADCFELDKWGSGERAFIRHLFTTCEKTEAGENPKNFFDDYLEPLFYEALNKKRGKNSYYKRFNCRIPFLNGGLFKPLKKYNWENVDFAIPNTFFSNKAKTGVLDVFDNYNFTMCEDEPLEREVAVDPEMLGKIFENLLDTKDRKSKGAFYTPREIVHYMCSETLTNYLVNKTGIVYDEIKEFVLFGDNPKVSNVNDNPNIIKNAAKLDEALKNIKVADPAVGSGAFPLGMLSEIVKLRSTLSKYIIENMYPIPYGASESQAKQMNRYRAEEYAKRNQYDLKLETIQNSIFAVDIEASAVDIAKLRLWLSLVVDEDLDPTQEQQQFGDNKQADPRPLPNLDYNIMCGNSLVDEFEGIKLFDEKLLTKKDCKTNDFDTGIQMNLFGGFKKIIDDLLEDLFRKQEALFGEQDNEKKEKLIANIESDIDEIIRAKLNSENNTDGLAKYEECIGRKSKPFFLWKLYFGKIFKENGGFDVVIGNPPYGLIYDEINKKILEKTYSTFKRNNDIYIAFYHQGIHLLGNNGVLSFITPNTFLNGDYFKSLRTLIKSETYINKIVDYKDIPIFNDPTVFVSIMFLIACDNIKYPYNFELKVANSSQNTFNEYEITVNCINDIPIKPLNNIFEKVKKQSNFKVFDDLFFVKDVGFNYWSKGNGKTRSQNSIGKRVLYEEPQIDEDDIPFIKGRDFSKYSTPIPHNYLKHNYNDYLDAKIDTFRFSETILKTNPKIVYRQTSNKIIATLDDMELFTDKTVHIIFPRDNYNDGLLVILAFLNSKLYEYLYYQISQETSGRAFSQVKTVYIKQIPILKVDGQSKSILENFVNRIITAKQSDPTADTLELEAQIDKIVYELYSLTDEEIKIVEESVK